MADTINGRRYHTDNESPYTLPNDQPEAQRLREQHEATLDLMHGQPIHAPLDSPKKILDIGCGVNADMTLLMAKNYPNATIYAVDLSPVDVPFPPNVRFIQGNMATLISQNDPRLPLGSFDYVFSRFMIGAIKDWFEWIHKTIAPLLAPGGWMELHDSPAFEWYNRKTGQLVSKDWKWLQTYRHYTEKIGLGGYVDRQLKTALPDILHSAPVGLEEIQTKWYQAPWAPVPGRPETEKFARYAEGTLAGTIKSAVDRIIPAAELPEAVADIERTMGKRMDDVYFPLLVVWARRLES